MHAPDPGRVLGQQLQVRRLDEHPEPVPTVLGQHEGARLVGRRRMVQGPVQLGVGHELAGPHVLGGGREEPTAHRLTGALGVGDPLGVPLLGLDLHLPDGRVGAHPGQEDGKTVEVLRRRAPDPAQGPVCGARGLAGPRALAGPRRSAGGGAPRRSVGSRSGSRTEETCASEVLSTRGIRTHRPPTAALRRARGEGC
ncbi:hypothetical protein [Ornithinimicrobium avium]|uniref:hypothetical protein n=1 Tax=Ornithinimicrobium avium TaxID=2283195 RepID=UPI0013B35947|nr:hypothetical protein [Ornithinimicrobium avium]